MSRDCFAVRIKMMKLYTSVDIAPSEKKIGYQDKILLLGSCFADNVGEKFGEYYFQTTINPFGTLYNPVSIANNLLPIASDHLPVVCHNGLWHSMMHHGGFRIQIKMSYCSVVRRAEL